MSNLFSALRSTADALGVFNKALTVTQNNVTNAQTPGYVTQTLALQAQPFDPNSGLSGGVAAPEVDSARDVFAEQSVQRESTALGQWEQEAATLSPLQSDFDLSGQTGIPGALSQLTKTFSAWSSAPNDPAARQDVITAAQGVAQSFNQTATAVDKAITGADGQLQDLVGKVNSLAAQLRQDNVQRKAGGAQDPALDANVYSTLEQLSQIAPITALPQADGSMTVLLGGQTPLVIGDQQYQISAGPAGAPQAQILDAGGKDVTEQIAGGQIGGLLQARNMVLPGVMGDLNLMAGTVAGRVNSLLTSGNISDGPPAVPGVPLFQPPMAGAEAQTLAVDPNVTPAQLAAIAPGPPEVGNGIALALANLATPQSAADEINGQSYAQFFGSTAARVGSAISTAQDNQTVQQNVVTQAQNLRQQTSGVSLDQQAVQVLEYQRAYQAASKMVTVLDSLTQTVINMVQ